MIFEEGESNPLVVKLKEILAQEDTVLFIGAGLSQWSGLPSWPDLIQELADFLDQNGLSSELVRKEASGNDLIQAASYGVDQLTKPQFSEFIRKACRVGIATPHAVHKKVVKLGPRCFITTNYDHLLEDVIRQEQSEHIFRVVNNKQFTEIANIIQARSRDYIFKPHGDIDDIDSIILTREQYRTLHGDRIAALKAMETLLVSRPIVFLGFGLKDLDFMYLKDLIANTYKGGACDNYAIMADVTKQQIDYWRNNYGIHILTYQSAGKGHALQLDILDYLLEAPYERSMEISEEQLSSNQVLSIARYGAGLIYKLDVDSVSELPLQVTLSERHLQRNKLSSAIRYDDTRVEYFLENISTNALLIGNPGAGKSYALKKFCTRMAAELRDICLTNPEKFSDVTIPIYLDLKYYKGDLWKMVEGVLPPELPFSLLLKKGNIKLFLDSFNEMPREHFENNKYEQDFTYFLHEIKPFRVIIASRTNEGLQKFGFVEFQLEHINKEFIEKHLETSGYHIEGRFRSEIIKLLQIPLFFRLYSEGRIDVDHPHLVYESFFTKLEKKFEKKYKESVDMSQILAPIAYSSIEEGQEALTLTQLESQLDNLLCQVNISSCDAGEFINWLIAQGVLVPAPDLHLAFFHQSITEYLAAKELSKNYIVAPEILERCLMNTRWDQALFLVLGFLKEEKANNFIQQILKADLTLAIRAVKYIENENDLNSIIAEILDHINDIIDPSDMRSYFDICFTLDRLPVSFDHEEELRKMLRKHNMLGGAAAKLLVDLRGDSVKDELIEDVFNNPSDYNYCTKVGEVLRPFASLDDLIDIMGRLKYKEQKVKEDEVTGLTSGLANLFYDIELGNLLDSFQPWQKLNDVQLDFISDILFHNRTGISLSYCVDLARLGITEAMFPLYMKLAFPDDEKEVNIDLFDERLVNELILSLGGERAGMWAIRILRIICQHRADLSELIKTFASQKKGILQLSLLYSNIDKDSIAFWNKTNQMANGGIPNLDSEPLVLLQGFDIEWAGKEQVLINLLKQRKMEFTRFLLEPLLRPRGQDFEISLELLKPLEWWLDWMNEVIETKGEDEGYWFCNRLGHLLSTYSSDEALSAFISLFNKNDCPYRKVLADYVLNGIPDLSTDMLSDNAISFLITDLSRERIDIFHYVLGSIATESFVREHLIPLLSLDDHVLKSNLRNVLRIAGQRHRRRYIRES